MHTPSSLLFQNTPLHAACRVSVHPSPRHSCLFVLSVSQLGSFRLHSVVDRKTRETRKPFDKSVPTKLFNSYACPPAPSPHLVLESKRPRLVHRTAVRKCFHSKLALNAHKQYTQLREGSCRAYVRNSCKLNFLNRTVRAPCSCARPGDAPDPGERCGDWGLARRI